MTHTRDHRETQAEAEVGVTTIAPRIALCWVVFFLAVISGPLLWDGFRTLRGIDEGQFDTIGAAVSIVPTPDEVVAAINDHGVFDGLDRINAATRRNMGNFEDRVEMYAPLREELLRPFNRWLSGGLGASNGDVYPGRDGWLFYGPALRHVTGPGFLAENRAQAPTAVDALVAFQAELSKRNIALVIVPVPSKASIYPEAFAPGSEAMAPLLNPSHEAFVQRLEASGIAVIDPTSLLVASKGEFETYLAQDSHWSPEGMEVVAEVVARHIETHVTLSATDTRNYRQVKGQPIDHIGDLAAMLLLDEARGVQTTPVVDRAGKPWRPIEGSEVLLLGDSFTNIYGMPDLGWGTGAGFAEQLSYYLQRPVDRISQNDQGALAPRKGLSDALATGRDVLANTRVVVYEFAARELSWGDWRVDLPLILGTAPEEGLQAGPMTLSGRVAEISQPPTPGSVPYKDCIISMALEMDDGIGGERALVYAWGMRDHQWTEVSQWRVGQTVEIDVTPWADVSDGLESVNRMPLPGDRETAYSPWWFDGGTEAVALPLRPATPEVVTGVDAGHLTEQVRGWERSGQQVLTGKEDWLFFVPELRSLSVGPFWGEDAIRVSRARNHAYADPLPAIRDFDQQLEAAGVELILVPVPPKSAIYRDMLGDADLEAAVAIATGASSPLSKFIDLLRAEGMNVVDLRAAFEDARADDNPPLYCRTDSHWSPAACTIAAEEVAKIIRLQPWYERRPKMEYAERSLEVPINGDLMAMTEEDVDRETITVAQIGTLSGNEFLPIAPDRESPVLLIGDSHNLVFHAGGDLHATGAGLPEHLARALGFPVDVVAVRGSGATTPRINIARRQDNLAGKNVVVWCFSSREFSESATGWRVVPVLQ